MDVSLATRETRSYTLKLDLAHALHEYYYWRAIQNGWVGRTGSGMAGRNRTGRMSNQSYTRMSSRGGAAVYITWDIGDIVKRDVRMCKST